MRIIQIKGAIKLNYKSQILRTVYDSSYPNNPFWLNSDLSKLLNIKKEGFTSQSLPKTYKAAIVTINKSYKITTLECVTTEGLLNLINRRARKPEIEEFLNWLESTAIPCIKEEGSKIVDSVAEQAAKEATTIEPGTIILKQQEPTVEPTVEPLASALTTTTSEPVESDLGGLLQFMFNDHEVRVIETETGLNWVAVDICNALDIKNSRDTLQRLDSCFKGVGIFDTPGGKQTISTVNEAGLYKIIFSSSKPAAKQFQQWVLETVILSIRKNGYYSTKAQLKNEQLIELETQLELAVKQLKKDENEIYMVNRRHDQLKIVLLEKEKSYMSLSNIKDELINENRYLSVMSNDADKRLEQAESRLDEALKMNRQLSELLNKIVE